MNEKSKLEKAQIVADILGKVLLPIIVILVTVWWSQHQKEILQEKHDNDLELEYLRIFYTDITSDIPIRRKVAAALLKELKPELQEKLMKALASVDPDRGMQLSTSIANDKTQSTKTRSSAQNIAFNIARQFEIKSPLDSDSVGRIVYVKGKSPYINRNHYLIVAPEGKGDFISDASVIMSSDGSFVVNATLGSAAQGIGEQFSLRVIATEILLSRDQIRNNSIPLDAFTSNSVTVMRSR